MNSMRPTVADLLAEKGLRQRANVYVDSLDEARAAGHVGLIPARRTWTGGFKAVGKTAASALSVLEQTKALEEAGAFAAEIEVVPAAVATAISQQTSLYMISMGSGSGCDAQYLFSTDILGTNRGHVPRHAKQYRDLAAEEDRIQAERVAAFTEYVADVESGTFPDDSRLVIMDASELADFEARLEQEST